MKVTTRSRLQEMTMNISPRTSILASALFIIGVSAAPYLPPLTAAFGTNGDPLQKVEARHNSFLKTQTAYRAPRARLAFPGKAPLAADERTNHESILQDNAQLKASQERFVLEVSRLRQKVRALEHRNAMMKLNTSAPAEAANEGSEADSAPDSTQLSDHKDRLLKQEITRKLLNEIHRLRVNLSKKQEEISRLQLSKSALKRGAENEILRQQQEVLMDRIIQLQRRLRSKQKPVAEGSLNQRDETLLRVKELELALAKREDRIAELQDQHKNSLKSQSSASQRSRKELLNQLRSSQEELQQQLAHEQRRANKLEQQYNWAKQEVRSLRHFSQERRKLNRDLLDAKNENKRLEVEVATLKSLDEQNDSLRHKLIQAREQLDDVKTASQKFIQASPSEREVEISRNGVRSTASRKSAPEYTEDDIHIDVPNTSGQDIDVQDLIDEAKNEVPTLIEPGTNSSSQLGFR